MTFKTLSEYFEKLEKTPKRLEITAILAELFNKAKQNEIYEIVFLSLGTIGPNYESHKFSIAEKTMIRAISKAYNQREKDVLSNFKMLGDLGLTAKELANKISVSINQEELSVLKVFNLLSEIAKASGIGSQDRKIGLMAMLLKNLDSNSAKFAVRITLGTMRLGFSETTLIEALSWMEKKDKSLKKEIEAKYRIYPNIGFIAKHFKESGVLGLKNIEIEVGVPILSARCQRVSNAEEIIERHEKSAIEYKYDGTRVQLHIDKAKTLKDEDNPLFKGTDKIFVRTYTRNLEETTHMFPDVIESVLKQVNAESVVLDCEAVGVDPKTGKFVSFQVTITRKRKHNIEEALKAVPLKLIIFDILYCNGKSLINTPFSERRQILKNIVKENNKVSLAPEIIVDNTKRFLEVFNDAVNKGLEGVVAKDLNAYYTIGSRGYAWIKFKREEDSDLEDTLEPVVLGYYKGSGQRVKFGIGAFLVGVLDEDEDNFKTIAKIGTGKLTDEQWVELRKRCDKIREKEIPKDYVVPKELFCDVWVSPKIMVSIRADEITVSPIHTAGFALRFPRLMAFRDDIAPKDATTVKEIKKLYKLWKK